MMSHNAIQRPTLWITWTTARNNINKRLFNWKRIKSSFEFNSKLTGHCTRFWPAAFCIIQRQRAIKLEQLSVSTGWRSTVCFRTSEIKLHLKAHDGSSHFMFGTSIPMWLRRQCTYKIDELKIKQDLFDGTTIVIRVSAIPNQEETTEIECKTRTSVWNTHLEFIKEKQANYCLLCWRIFCWEHQSQHLGVFCENQQAWWWPCLSIQRAQTLPNSATYKHWSISHHYVLPS